jgi:hypothetical protein
MGRFTGSSDPTAAAAHCWPERTLRVSSEFFTLSPNGGGGNPGKRLTPSQAHFEAWLYSEGYRPADQRHAEEGTEGGDRLTDNAADLVWDYLEDHPEDEPYRKELLGHAAAIGEVRHFRSGDDGATGSKLQRGRPDR